MRRRKCLLRSTQGLQGQLLFLLAYDTERETAAKTSFADAPAPAARQSVLAG